MPGWRVSKLRDMCGTFKPPHGWGRHEIRSRPVASLAARTIGYNGRRLGRPLAGFARGARVADACFCAAADLAIAANPNEARLGRPPQPSARARVPTQILNPILASDMDGVDRELRG